jgi:hypothetical protein
VGDAEDADSTPSEQVDDDDLESLAPTRPEHANADLNLGKELQDTCNQVEVVEEEAINMTVEVERVGTAGREVCSVDTVIFPTGAVRSADDIPIVDSRRPSANDIVSFTLSMNVEHVRRTHQNSLE